MENVACLEDVTWLAYKANQLVALSDALLPKGRGTHIVMYFKTSNRRSELRVYMRILATRGENKHLEKNLAKINNCVV